ncbi:MAG: hypothetical protein HY558_00435 [Euryarchaeota archaeon]|nr:hypothetical protein [Euryarchaeota archaeon]
MAEDYEDALRANLKKLSSIGTNIEELRERPLKKIQEHEIVLHRILNLCKGFLTKEEVKEMQASLDALQERLGSMEKSLKELSGKVERETQVNLAPLQERLGSMEKSLKESVRKLSQVDSEIIGELSKVQSLLAAETEEPPRLTEMLPEPERARPPEREAKPPRAPRGPPATSSGSGTSSSPCSASSPRTTTPGSSPRRPTRRPSKGERSASDRLRPRLRRPPDRYGIYTTVKPFSFFSD